MTLGGFICVGECVCVCVSVCVSVCVCVQGLSCFSCVLPFGTLQTVARQDPQSMQFFRREYWSGLPFPSLEDLPNPAIKPTSPRSAALKVDSFSAEPPGKPM